MKQFGLDIELDEAVAQGNYSNLVIISHSTSEFILDFATMLPGLQKARVKSRIILTPEHAKRLLLSLQDNIVRYESNVGKSRFPGRSRFPSRVPRWVRPEAGRGRGGGAGDRNWGAKQGTGLGLERDGVLRSGTAGCLPTLSVLVAPRWYKPEPKPGEWLERCDGSDCGVAGLILWLFVCSSRWSETYAFCPQKARLRKVASALYSQKIRAFGLLGLPFDCANRLSLLFPLAAPAVTVVSPFAPGLLFCLS